jgi:hypothetical protein
MHPTDQKDIKYIHIRHWDYWFGVYNIGQYHPDWVNGVEFNLTNDQEGTNIFFHLDLHTIPSLEDIFTTNDYLELDDPLYPQFLKKCHELKTGEINYFIGSLYYKDFNPSFQDYDLKGRSVFDIKSPSCSPYYADIFINEKNPLLPETLIIWLKSLSKELFQEDFDFILMDIPDREMATVGFKSFYDS